MSRSYPINFVLDARVLADGAEQIAHNIRRTRAAAEAIADDVRVLWGAVSPLIDRLKSK